MRSLSRSLPLLVVGLLLVGGSASAVPITYFLYPGSTMTTVNAGGAKSIALTGSLTLDDDGVGNVTIISMSLAHGPFQIGSLPFLSVVTDRPSITLGAGSVAGTGSTMTSAIFATATSLAQVGTVTCTDGFLTCASQGAPPTGIPVPLPSPIPVTIGTLTFTGLGTIMSGTFQYGPTVSGSTDTVTLVAQVPEPGTILLLGMGLVGLGIRRRTTH